MNNLRSNPVAISTREYSFGWETQVYGGIKGEGHRSRELAWEEEQRGD